MTTTIFENENIRKTVLTLGLPSMLGQLAALIYNMADTYFISLTRSPAQIAAVTLSTPILLIIVSISSICGMGGSSVIARLLGEKKIDKAKSCATFCFYAMAAAGIAVLAIGSLFIDPIAKFAGADMESIGYTCDYLRWIFFGSPFIILSNGMVHIFRSTGLIKEATIGIILGNAVNIVLDWLFIVRFQMGTAGAALATSIGFLCAAVYTIYCMLHATKTSEIYTFSPAAMHTVNPPVGDIVKIGIPGALITVMLSISNIVLNNHIGIYGSDAVAAYGIAYKLDMFPILLSVGFNQGVAPMIGYCYGAKQTRRVHTVMKYTLLYDLLFGALFTAAFLLASKPLVSLFLHEANLIDQAALFLRILGLSAPMLGIINTVIAYYQALGKGTSSLLITTMRNILLFIPGVILLNRLFGLYGSIAAQPIVETILAIICIFMYLASQKDHPTAAEKPLSRHRSVSFPA